MGKAKEVLESETSGITSKTTHLTSWDVGSVKHDSRKFPQEVALSCNFTSFVILN